MIIFMWQFKLLANISGINYLTGMEIEKILLLRSRN